MKTNKSFSNEPRIYNFNVKINLSIAHETIPILIPEKSLTEIQKVNTPQGKIQDPDPYFSIEEIEDITQPANKVEFTTEFWESYLAVLKERPIPGRKKGHLSPYSLETPENDFYTIGGKIEKNKVYLKIYIPPDGFETSNSGLIRDAKVGLLHFSIVSWTEDVIETDEDGMIKSIKAVRSVKGERNDRVEPGMGAMQQKVNKDGLPSENITEVLIMTENTYSDIIKNLKNQVENGTVAKSKICKDLGIEVVTDEHKASVKILNDIVAITGENPVEKIKTMKANEEKVKQESYENMRLKLMTDTFGPEKIGDKDNLKRLSAESLVSKVIVSDEELKKQVEQAKENPVVKHHSFKAADVNSQENDLTGISVTDEKTYRTTEHVEL